MNKDLEPCPFCGWVANLCMDDDDPDGEYCAPVCTNLDCVAAYFDSWYGTRAEAIKAWNTRAEVSDTFCEACRSAQKRKVAEAMTERTCRRVRDDVSGLDIPHNGWYVCSECGEPLPIINRYCGGCGARVVE